MTDDCENTDETDLILSKPVAGKSEICILPQQPDKHRYTLQFIQSTRFRQYFTYLFVTEMQNCCQNRNRSSTTPNRFLHSCKTPYTTALLGVSDVSKENSEQGRIFHSSDTARDMRKLMRILGNVNVYNSNTNKHTAF